MEMNNKTGTNFESLLDETINSHQFQSLKACETEKTNQCSNNVVQELQPVKLQKSEKIPVTLSTEVSQR